MKRILLAFLLVIATAGAHAQVLPYRISAVIEMPRSSEARGLSNAGHIVGNWVSGERQVDAFIWKKGVIELLEPAQGSTTSVAAAVNSHGHVIGNSTYATMWTDGVPKTLRRLADEPTGGFDLNEAGVAVGLFGFPDTGSRAFIYKDGVMTNLGSMGWYESSAVAINNNNVVVGTLRAEHAGSSAFIWDEENGMRYLVDRNYTGTPEDINDLNQVLTFGGIWLDGNRIVDFDSGFIGYDLTNTGWVGGANRWFNYTPAIWRDGQSYLVRDLVTDLQGWELVEFNAMNDSAYLVVSARRGNSLATLYLEPVPEPGTMISLGAGVLYLFVRRARRIHELGSDLYRSLDEEHNRRLKSC